MVHQVPAGASIASLPWHGARVAGAPPHESLGAGAPTDTVPADDAGVFVVCSTVVRTRCVALAKSRACLSRRLPAVWWYRESRPASEVVIRPCAFLLVCRVAFPWSASLGCRAGVPVVRLVLVLPRARLLAALARAFLAPWVRPEVVAAFPFGAGLVLAWVHVPQAQAPWAEWNRVPSPLPTG